MKIAYVDIDNTLLDVQGGIKAQFPEFDPSNMRTYSFSEYCPEIAQSIYSCFSDISFYSGLRFNSEVVKACSELKDLGYWIVGVTFSPNKEIHRHKNVLVSDFVDEFCPYLEDSKSVLEYIKFRTSLGNYEKVAYIDDAPERLEFYIKMRKDYNMVDCVVHHPYNKGYHGGIGLMPNYLLEEEVF